jgi:hypothetical protein
MANALSMARSFYSWMAKIEVKESNAFVMARLPNFYPTAPHLLVPLTEALCSKLRDTKYHAKAVYWNKIFESFAADACLNEGVFRKFVDVLKHLFVTPPPEAVPEDPILLRKIIAAREWVKQKWEIEVETRRKEFPTYQTLKDYFKEYEYGVMADVLDVSGLAHEEEMTPENKRRWKWKTRCFWFSFPLNLAALWRALESSMSFSAIGVEYGYAISTAILSVLAHAVEKVWGESRAREIFG